MAYLILFLWVMSGSLYALLMMIDFSVSYAKKMTFLKCVLSCLYLSFLVTIWYSSNLYQDIGVKFLFSVGSVFVFWKIYRGSLFCVSCANPIIKSSFQDAKFCPKCGAPLTNKEKSK